MLGTRFSFDGRSGQFTYLLAATLSSFTLSATYAWLTPLLYHFKQPDSNIHLTSIETTCLTILADLSNAVFSVPVSYLADVIGRKPILCSTGPICAVSWLLVALIPDKGILFAMRAVQGIAVSVSYSVLPVYLSEVASVEIRGSAVSSVGTLWQLGSVYIYLIGNFFGFQGITWFTLAPNVITAILFFWCPESPYWYMQKNRKEDAINALLQMRGGCSTDSHIVEEMKIIEHSVENDKEFKKGILKNIVFSRKDRKSFLIVEGITIICMFVGSNAIPINASDTVAILSGSVSFSNYTTLVFGVVLLLMSFPSMILADRWGRRPILLLSSAVAFFVFLAASLFLYYLEIEHVNSSAMVALSFLCILVGASFNSFGVFTLQSVLVGEMFRTKSRSVISGITSSVYSSSSAASLALYSYLEDNFGIYANFIVFSVFSCIGFVTYQIALPETKGKSFNEIQDSL